MNRLRTSYCFISVLMFLNACGPSDQQVALEKEAAEDAKRLVANAGKHISEINSAEGRSTPVSDGKEIAAPSDPNARYWLLSVDKMANGNVEVLSRRQGSSGISLARREIDCRGIYLSVFG